jgi:hypothetical protein
LNIDPNNVDFVDMNVEVLIEEDTKEEDNIIEYGNDIKEEDIIIEDGSNQKDKSEEINVEYKKKGNIMIDDVKDEIKDIKAEDSNAADFIEHLKYKDEAIKVEDIKEEVIEGVFDPLNE